MENKIKIEWKTRDFYIASCILASKISLVRLQKETNKIVSFVFNTTPENAEQIIQKHWNRELILPTRNLIEAIHELKTRIFETL